MVNDERDKTAPADPELQEAFGALRAQVTRPGGVPDFQEMMDRARSRAEDSPAAGSPSRIDLPGPVDLTRYRRTRRLAAWVSLAAAATVATLFWMNGPSAADREFQRVVAAYTRNVEGGVLRSPTSALLRTPGLDLGAVPSFQGALQGFDRNTSPKAPESGGRDS